jgi:hypothetical protein
LQSSANKLRHRESYEERTVSPEEQKILDAACSVATSRASSDQMYEFVARCIAQGIAYGGERVLLASPLYIAPIDQFDAS